MSEVSEWDSAPLVGVVNEPEGIWDLMIDPHVKLLWCDALESGEYKKGHWYLRTTDDVSGDFFCPLGVLVDIATKNKVVAWERVSDENMYRVHGYHNSLPPTVAEWAGVDLSTFMLWGGQDFPLHWGGHWHPIWRLNDTYRMPFDVMSQLIRMQY